MTIEVKIPDLGDGVESGDVLEVFVNDGDTIEKGQDLIELETDKATVTVPSSAAGTITKIHVAEGDTIAVGGVIVTVEESVGASKDSQLKQEAVESAPQQSKQKSVKPETTPVAEVPITKDTVRKNVVAVESAADAIREVDAVEAKSAAREVAAKTETSAGEASKKLSAAASQVGVKVADQSKKASGNRIAAGPSIRRLAREVGIDLGTVTGSGDFGRITRDDLMKAVRDGASRKTAGDAVGGGGESDDFGPIRIEKMSRIRQTIARKMHESWETCPRVTNFDDADITDLEEIRQNSKKDYEARDIKLTTMPFVIKAVAMSLKSHPIINASVNLDDGQIIYKEYVNVGIAVDTERGLVVPSLRSADTLGIPKIARQLSELAERVRNNDFSIDDLRGGTFTISNLGAIGGTWSTPIINVPETAILLIGRSRKMPVVINDEIKIRLMMPLSLSYDHRLIDGGAAARFLNEVINYLEAPSRLLLAL